jgi:aspartyl-tRNA(Asn)/glutamyl-tRNA(Gln) amidotransferase subunit A
MNNEKIHKLSLVQLAKKIRLKEISPIQVTEYYLDKIKLNNGKINAFIYLAEKEALKNAENAENEISKGLYRGLLHGIPFAAKDIIDTKNIITTQGAKLYRNNIPIQNAVCVEKLEESGAILLGKTNTHQYAAASTTINSYFGTTRNPHNLEKIVGGSSGGSAAAIAAGLTPLALGSDTGGSIRTPAALCGIVGLKPTHGRVSLRGVFPNTPSLDHIGPMAQTVFDAAIMLNVISGYDQKDPYSQDRQVCDFTKDIEKSIKGDKILLCPDIYNNCEVDDEIYRAFNECIYILKQLGAKVEKTSFKNSKKLEELFYRIAGPEFSEVHREQYTKDPLSFDEDVRSRVKWSLKITQDDYIMAMREKELITREVLDILKNYKSLITPSVPCVAPSIKTLKAEINGKEFDYLKSIHRPFLSPHNITGCPSIVIPIGKNKDKLPMSIQIIGEKWKEKNIIQVANSLEKVISYKSGIN